MEGLLRNIELICAPCRRINHCWCSLWIMHSSCVSRRSGVMPCEAHHRAVKIQGGPASDRKDFLKSSILAVGWKVDQCKDFRRLKLVWWSLMPQICWNDLAQIEHLNIYNWEIHIIFDSNLSLKWTFLLVKVAPATSIFKLFWRLGQQKFETNWYENQIYSTVWCTFKLDGKNLNKS